MSNESSFEEFSRCRTKIERDQILESKMKNFFRLQTDNLFFGAVLLYRGYFKSIKTDMINFRKNPKKAPLTIQNIIN